MDPPLPPWERRDVVQVPYFDSGSPCLSNAERAALPSLWATRTATSTNRPRMYADRQGSTSSTGYFPASPDEHRNPWNREPPHTALPLQVSAPYDSPIYIPPAPKTAPPPAQYVRPKAPPTPPESVTNSSTLPSPEDSPSMQQSAATTALPGTMSTRPRSASRGRAKKSNSRRIQEQQQQQAETVPLGKRFKSAFKDMFKRTPINENDFERIEDRHWTEEY